MTRRVLVTRPAWTNATTIRQALAEVWGDGTAVLVIGASPGASITSRGAPVGAVGAQVKRHPAD
jgi:hypothetical protein